MFLPICISNATLGKRKGARVGHYKRIEGEEFNNKAKTCLSNNSFKDRTRNKSWQGVGNF